jgi:glycosyltransferase involved in cell wall biosynthesis
MSGPVISVYPSDADACGNFRLRYPAEALISQGHTNVVLNPFREHHPIEINVTNREAGNGIEIVGVSNVEADVVVVQRWASERLHTIMGMLKTQGVKVVMDIDDALWNIHPRNVAWGVYNTDTTRHWRWLLRCAKLADLVTVTTPALAEKIRGKVEVVPNFIPEARLKVGETKLGDEGMGVTVAGWAATSLTHPTDAQVTGGQVAMWVRDGGQTRMFLSVGGKPDRECALFGFNEEDYAMGLCDATGEVPREQWPWMLSLMDISLVPLADTQFNRGKSALKMLESAAAGCAVVASPTPDNVRIAEHHGIGVIAKDNKWGKVLNRTRWREQARENLEQVRFLTIERNAKLWLDAWESVL